MALQIWVPLFSLILVICLVGNKRDLVTDQQALNSDIEDYAKVKSNQLSFQQFNGIHLETSAENGLNVDKLFTSITDMLLERKGRNMTKMIDGAKKIGTGEQDNKLTLKEINKKNKSDRVCKC